MVRHGAALLALFAALQLSAASEWVVETNSLKVKEPSSLKGRYDVAIGDFGVPLYGASMQGQLLYVSSNAKGCSEFGDEFKPKNGERSQNSIALVDRGDCYFLEKAFNAEKAGARAILVADDREEQLLTMAAPEDRPEIAKLREDITIPTALITAELGRTLKDGLKTATVPIIVELDWSDSVVNPDDRVEWEFWTSSNDGCGNSCDIQTRFKKQFHDTAVRLERGFDALFTPHFNSRECTAGADSEDCQNDCINHGRYCAMDSIGDAYKDRFKGWQVVEENKRQLCVFNLTRELGEPWVWWDFVGGYATRCTFETGLFNDAECAKREVEALQLDNARVLACMGDSNANSEHPLLQADFELEGQNIFGGARILLLPTIIINTNQYRGRLDTPSVTRALCAGYSEGTEPSICLQGGLQTDECVTNTHECWVGEGRSACVDTFRGYQCQCPPGYQGDGRNCTDIDECAAGTALCDQVCVNEHGGFRCACDDGFKLVGKASVAYCTPVNLCKDNNGGCEDMCRSEDGIKQCSCGKGLRLAEDGHACADIDECAEGVSGCQQGCENKDPRNAAGVQFVCKCNKGYANSPESPDKCVEQSQYLQMLGFSSTITGGASLSWTSIAGLTVATAAVVMLAGVAVYKLRMRHVMQSEIQSIMRQYMPLEGNNFAEPPPEGGQALRNVKSEIKAQYAEEQC